MTIKSYYFNTYITISENDLESIYELYEIFFRNIKQKVFLSRDHFLNNPVCAIDHILIHAEAADAKELYQLINL